MSKYCILFLCFFALWINLGCVQDHKADCQIMGTVEGHALDGKTIYLVPVLGPHDASHVDSATISNGRFRFAVDSAEVKVIRVGYRYRENIEDLLVVSEPGTVKAHIGKISSCGGTPQNDSLQAWKEQMEQFRQTLAMLQQAKMQSSRPDTVNLLLTQLYRHQQQSIAAFTKRQPKGALRDFLQKLYPNIQ